MKEANTLINSVIYLPLFLPTIFGGPICKTGNPVTDDIKRIDELVGNLPNDYKIQIKYISKIPNVTDTCWLRLTVSEMSFSLDGLLEKFAKNSSNYLIIENLHRVLNGIHNCLYEDRKDYQEESEFNCEKSNLEPKQYFSYFNEIITAFQLAEDTNPCDAEAVCRPTEPPDAEATTPETGDPNTMKGECANCVTSVDYLPAIGTSVVCTVIITICLTYLVIRVQKNYERNRRIKSYSTDVEQERKREENEQDGQFILENQESLT
ncbi:kit ligand a isoform X2 [Stegostoma tigrinum]|uniref:kit ligand a isoform X2 n=1 Tax=Stegostoma tigrinum TaxID=3053191 RepID=UPI00202B8601|nr:kit ligand a isoform X2 [Stegostoma tigrinum]